MTRIFLKRSRWEEALRATMRADEQLQEHVSARLEGTGRTVEVIVTNRVLMLVDWYEPERFQRRYPRSENLRVGRNPATRDRMEVILRSSQGQPQMSAPIMTESTRP